MNESKSDLLTLEIPAVTKSIELIRLMVAGLSARINFTYDKVEDLKLALETACSKVIESGTSSDISIQFEVFFDHLQISLRDLPFNILGEDNTGKLILKATIDEVKLETRGDKYNLFLTKFIDKKKI